MSAEAGPIAGPVAPMPMSGRRVLHVNKFLFRKGGSEAYMHDVAELQAQSGACVDFFAMEHADNPRAPLERHFAPYMSLDPPPAGLGAKIRTARRIVWNGAAAAGIR